jgi:hypothetical protein
MVLEGVEILMDPQGWFHSELPVDRDINGDISVTTDTKQDLMQ